MKMSSALDKSRFDPKTGRVRLGVQRAGHEIMHEACHSQQHAERDPLLWLQRKTRFVPWLRWVTLYLVERDCYWRTRRALIASGRFTARIDRRMRLDLGTYRAQIGRF